MKPERLKLRIFWGVAVITLLLFVFHKSTDSEIQHTATQPTLDSPPDVGVLNGYAKTHELVNNDSLGIYSDFVHRLDAIEELPPELRLHEFGKLVKDWGSVDPEGLMSWIVESEESYRGLDLYFRQVGLALSSQGPGRLIDFASQLNGSNGCSVLGEYVRTIEGERDFKEFSGRLAELPEIYTQRIVGRHLAESWVKLYSDDAIDWFTSESKLPIFQQRQIAVGLAEGLAKSDPSMALGWIDQLPGSLREDALTAFAVTLSRYTRPDEVLGLLEAGVSSDRDRLVEVVVDNLQYKAPRSALEAVSLVESKKLASELEGKVLSNWIETERSEAMEWLTRTVSSSQEKLPLAKNLVVEEARNHVLGSLKLIDSFPSDLRRQAIMQIGMAWRHSPPPGGIASLREYANLTDSELQMIESFIE